jgi:chromosome segregation ATPase
MNDSITEGRMRLVLVYLVSSVALITCIALNFFDDLDRRYAIAIFCIFLLLIYFGYKDAKRDSIILTKNGETIYFLGYLTTIMALIVTAFKIQSDPKLLNNLGELLAKGAFAITSTVGGLVGMFFFRVMAHHFDPHDSAGDQAYDTSQGMQEAVIEFSKKSNEYLDSLKNNTEQVVAQLAQFGSEHAVALGKAFTKIAGLSASVESLTENVTRITGNLEVLEKSASGAGAALAEVAAHATTIQVVATKLDQISNSLLPAWQQVTGHIEAATNLTQKVSDLGQTLDHLQVGFGTCQDEMKKFTETCKGSEGLLLETLDKVQQRAKDVGDVAEGVKKFVDAANSIAPAINAISENLSEIVSIKDAVGQLRTNVQNLNEALVNSSNATGLISENSRKLTIDISNLVTEMKTQFHKLGQSAETIGKFSSTMLAIEPQLETVEKSIASLGSFAIGVSGVQKSLDELKTAAEQASLQMRGLDKVVASYFKTVELFEKRGSSFGLPGR